MTVESDRVTLLLLYLVNDEFPAIGFKYTPSRVCYRQVHAQTGIKIFSQLILLLVWSFG